MKKITVLIISSLLLISAYGQRITPDGTVVWIEDLGVQTAYRSELIVKVHEVDRRIAALKTLIGNKGGDYQAYNDSNFANSISGLESYSVNGAKSVIFVRTAGNGAHRVRKNTVEFIITPWDSIVDGVPTSGQDTVINNIDVAFNTITLQSGNQFRWNSKNFVRIINRVGEAIWRNEKNWREWFR